MAELRQDVEAIEKAGQLCLSFHSQQGGHLTSFKTTVASLRLNWESKRPTQVFDDAILKLTRHAEEQQAAIERIRALLVRQGANVDEMTAGQTADMQTLTDEVESLRIGIS